MKCSFKYFLNTVLFDQPVSLTIPETPGVAPSRSYDLILFPTNTKYGGIAVPKALPDPRTVTIPDIPLVTDTGVTCLSPTTLGGL
jgi:hypothetical protein